MSSPVRDVVIVCPPGLRSTLPGRASGGPYRRFTVGVMCIGYGLER